MTSTLQLLTLAQAAPVRLVNETVRASDPWPVGYTMTVWGVAIGATVLVALAVSTWMRMSADTRALLLQSFYWRLSPRQVLTLRAAARASGTPASALLVSRGAFEGAAAVWAAEHPGDGPTAASRRALSSLTLRVFGGEHSVPRPIR